MPRWVMIVLLVVLEAHFVKGLGQQSVYKITFWNSQQNSGPSAAAIRLMSDYKYLMEHSPEGISASPCSEDNLFHWNATIIGPDNSPWEGGIFQLSLSFPDNFPEKPPKVRFQSEMFHPNVYGDGSICLDILQDKWSPILRVSDILISIASLLTDPNPNSPANPVAAALFKNDIQEYNKRVRKIVERSQE